MHLIAIFNLRTLEGWKTYLVLTDYWWKNWNFKLRGNVFKRNTWSKRSGRMKKKLLKYAKDLKFWMNIKVSHKIGSDILTSFLREGTWESKENMKKQLFHFRGLHAVCAFNNSLPFYLIFPFTNYLFLWFISCFFTVFLSFKWSNNFLFC